VIAGHRRPQLSVVVQADSTGCDLTAGFGDLLADGGRQLAQHSLDGQRLARLHLDADISRQDRVSVEILQLLDQLIDLAVAPKLQGQVLQHQVGEGQVSLGAQAGGTELGNGVDGETIKERALDADPRLDCA
jgi:hypothetical protein